MVVALFLGLAWVAGITPDWILYDHWSDSKNYPTNWPDAALHPRAHGPNKHPGVWRG